MARKQKFVVSLPRVPGISRRHMADYIRQAVQMWSGQYEPPGPDSPGDVMFVAIYQNQKSVTVRPITN